MHSIRTLVLAAAAVAIAVLAFPAALLASEGGSEEKTVYLSMQTNKGELVLELFPQHAPVTVENFVKYAEDDFFDGTIIHRVVPNFVIQGGGYTAEGTLKETRDPIKNEWRNGLTNDRGTLSMARTNAPDSATSQFFINLKDNENLDLPRAGRNPAPDYVKGAAYAVFGRVVEGMDVVDEIAAMETRPNPNIGGMPSPVETVVLGSVEVLGEERQAELREAHAESRREVLGKAEQRAEEIRQEVRKKQEVAEIAARPDEEQRSIAIDHLSEKGYDIDPAQAKTTDSGLWYYVLEEGEGAQPQPSDRVTVHYEGWFPNGEIFDSSIERGTPATFGLDQVIPGWTEGVGMMRQGGKRLLIIPGAIAYGQQARGPIPANATLVFEVELINVP